MESLETNQSFWSTEIAKDDFVALMDDAGFTQTEINNIEPTLLDPIIMAIGNNDGELELYLSPVNSGYFIKIGSRTIDEGGAGSTLMNIEETANSLKLNDIEHTEFAQLSQEGIDDIINNPDTILQMSCCRACYIVHDILDIHILDCICCAFTCNFNCGEGDLVTYDVYD